MDIADLLLELHGRIDEHVHEAVDGLDAEALVATLAPGTNPIGWQIWHLTRVEDSHVAELLDEEQVWITDPDHAAGVGITPDPDNTGYGHSEEQVAEIRPTGPAVLVAYHDAVAARTRRFLRTLDAEALDRVVDDAWDPPVTMGVRLVSVADDAIQHAGQATYLRGLLERS